jgi:hypothetical protein
MRNTADVTCGNPIAVLLQSISGVSAINPLVAFCDIHGGKREVLFFCPGHHTRLSLTKFDQSVLFDQFDQTTPNLSWYQVMQRLRTGAMLILNILRNIFIIMSFTYTYTFLLNQST